MLLLLLPALLLPLLLLLSAELLPAAGLPLPLPLREGLCSTGPAVAGLAEEAAGERALLSETRSPACRERRSTAEAPAAAEAAAAAAAGETG